VNDFHYDPTAFGDFDPDAGPEFEPLPKGDYEAVIAVAEAKTSKAGNPMIALTLEIDHDGSTRKVWDYLTFSDAAKGVVGNKCAALGLLDELKDGTLTPESFLGCMCRVRIKHETSEQYGTREKVAFYHQGTPQPKPAPAAPISEADIPF